MSQKLTCQYCGSHDLSRAERNTRPYAEVLHTCRRCGAATKVLSAHNPYRAETNSGFPEPPAVGEWSR